MMQRSNESPKLSGPEQGEANVTLFRAYLDGLKASGRSLPMEGGRPNVTAISGESRINRNAFYTNSGIKRLLREHLGVDAETPSEGGSSGRDREQVERLERDKLRLEQKLAAALAEIEELRQRLAAAEQKLSRYRIIEEEVLAAGRRVIP